MVSKFKDKLNKERKKAEEMAANAQNDQVVQQLRSERDMLRSQLDSLNKQ